MAVENKQFTSRAVAAELIAQALDVLKSGGNDEHGALSALEDALAARRAAWLQALGR